MRGLTTKLLTTAAMLQLATLGAVAQHVYQIDNGTPGPYIINASDGTEPLDNWFGNEFTAISGANLLNGVDWYVGSLSNANTQITSATLAIYTVGDPAIGATRVYTQNFTPIAGHIDHINLTTPVLVPVGDTFLVSILVRNVIGAPPNDVYPFVIDTSTTSTGSFWDRSAPGTFNLDNLDAARLLSYGLAPDGSGAPPFIPGGRLMLRADGIAVPEPATLALAGLGAAALLMFRRRNA
jgi:hypothetical protein